MKLKLTDKKLAPATKKPAAGARKGVVVAAPPSTLSRDEDIARQLDLEARKELSLFLSAHPDMVEDPDVRALEDAIQQDVNNRVTPGVHSLPMRIREQRARIDILRKKLQALRQDMETDFPTPASKLPQAPLHFAGEHASEYAVLAQEAHRATKRPGRRGWDKTQDGTTDAQSETDESDDESFDTLNDGVSKTGFH